MFLIHCKFVYRSRHFSVDTPPKKNPKKQIKKKKEKEKEKKKERYIKNINC